MKKYEVMFVVTYSYEEYYDGNYREVYKTVSAHNEREAVLEASKGEWPIFGEIYADEVK